MNKFKSYSIFLLTSFFGFAFFGFSQETDLSKIAESEPDTTRLNTFSKLSVEYTGKNKDSAYYYIEQGLPICKENQQSNDEFKDSTVASYCAQHYMAAGYYFYENNEFSDGLKYFKKAEKIYESLKMVKSQAECINNSAVIFTKMSNNSSAIIDYHRALKMYTKLNDSVGKAYTLNNLSKAYRAQNNIEDALKYIEASLKLSVALGNKPLETLSLNAYAGLHKEIGDTAAAIKLYQKALSIRKALKDSIGIAAVLNNIGSLYKNQQKYNDALEYFSDAQKIAENLGHREGVGHTLYNKGEVYFALNELNKAEKYGVRALSAGDSVRNSAIIGRAAELLMNVYKNQSNWKKAFEMQALKKEIDEKRLNQESQKIAQREAIKYEFEKERIINKKEEEQMKSLREERSERQKIFYIAIGLVTLLLVAFLFISFQRLRSAKQQNKLITKQSEERKMLLQEIHHRVKNNFQIVSSLLRLQSYSIDSEALRESFEEAVNRINSMAIVHDIIYRQEAFSEIDSKEYLEKLVKSLKHSSGNPKIDIVIDAQKPKLKIETLIHIGIALNELIINSFKYAFTRDHNNPKIRIILNEIGENEFELIYQDNGIGINKEIDQASFGMELIQTLIEHLEGSVKISSEKNWNTTISIRFRDV